MLSLTVCVPLKRRTLREKLHLCPKEKIVKESYFCTYGEINVYRIYHFSLKPFFTAQRLSSALKERLYSPCAEVSQEYLKNAVILKLISKLKENPSKTVFLKKEFCDTPYLGELCRYSERVYIMSDSLSDSAKEIYKKYGTLPRCTCVPVAADFCPDIKEPFSISLPEELKSICPAEFSPLLFASLLYKENGVMIV